MEKHLTIEQLEKIMKKIDPSAGCTYFPLEGKYLIFTNANLLEKKHFGAPRILTNNFHENKRDALIEAIEILKKT